MRCLVRVCGVRFIYDLFSAIEYNHNTIKIRPQNCDWDMYVTHVKDVKQELENLVKDGYADFSQYNTLYHEQVYYVKNGGNREIEPPYEIRDVSECDLDIDGLFRG